MACEPIKNPLQRSGTSQLDRRLPGLTPDYIRINEKRYSDWIVFAVEFSKTLRFFDSADGAALLGWQAFFAKDASAILGSFAVQNIETWRIGIRQRLDFLRDDKNAGDTTGLKKNLGEVISSVFTLTKALDEYYLQLDENLSFKNSLQRFIQAKLAPALHRLVSYYKGALSRSLYTPVTDPSWKILNKPLTDSAIIIADPTGLTSEWWNPSTGITGYASINADDSIFGTDMGVYNALSHGANHFLFTSIFDQFTESYAKLIADAELGLESTLNEMDGHAPHYALFLAFLKLFRTHQSQINTLTWKHLDFYYKDILRLAPKAAQPNQVHIVAELAKLANSAALPAGTLFRAGKDSLKKDVFYSLDRETVLNKGAVVHFKAIYRVDPSESWLDPVLKNSKRYFAAPIMNSADGLGSEIKSDLKEWHPFLNKAVESSGKISEILMPPAEIGFALASHYLFLAEGTRTISLRLGGDSFAGFAKEQFLCRLTAEKGWLEKTPMAIQVGTFSTGGVCTEIILKLTGSDPAIIAWNIKLHGGDFDCLLPMVQCVLKNETSLESYGLDELKNVSIENVEIKVQVGTETGGFNTTGAKQVFLANANGSIDSTKPFMPWGAQPSKDAPLFLGSKELFSKGNASFNLHLEWADRPTTLNPSPVAHLDFLGGGHWDKVSTSLSGGIICSASQQKTFTTAISVPTLANVDWREDYLGLLPGSRSGFMRLVLDGSFGHEIYAAAPDKNSKPYLPTLSAVYVNYSAASQPVDLTSCDPIAFENRAVRFFHLGPFGHAELDYPISGASGHFLLPQFRHATEPDHIGEWLLGIENLGPRQSVDILFQVLEGSTTPTLSKPENHVTWSYWTGTHWNKFEARDIGDATRQLIQSGIIHFTIPEDASVNGGIMPQGLIWIMASVTEAVSAVCKVLSVQSQALLATYAPNGNAEDFLSITLPANTISKLKSPDTRFKQFSQPYPTFGGRQAENRDSFYLRSSERLRHKGRAVTIWDFEHLVLEAFPQLYKVKCLNHTRIEDNPNAALAIYSENQPGYVSLVPVPNLQNRNDANLLKPYTNQNLLAEIREFLKTRISGQLVPVPDAPSQINVNVVNPLFEEIFLEFKLQLQAGYDDFTWYRQVLQEEITTFLSPWAFDGQTDVQFGGCIAKSALINFIEERPYVDFITEVILKTKPENQPMSGDVEMAEATTSRSILVSAPAAEHTILQYGLVP